MQTIFSQYWGLIIALLIGIIFTLLHFQLVYAYAKKVARTLMIAAEKRAEDLLLTDGQSKLNWVVDKGYDLLPAPVRIIISKPLFKIIVQDLFDAAVRFAKQHQIERQDTQPVAAAPAETVQEATI